MTLQIKSFVLQIVREGRELGEFERKTPLDETVESIHLALRPFMNPLLLQYNLDFVEEAPSLISNLVLRSLMPNSADGCAAHAYQRVRLKG